MESEKFSGTGEGPVLSEASPVREVGVKALGAGHIPELFGQTADRGAACVEGDPHVQVRSLALRRTALQRLFHSGPLLHPVANIPRPKWDHNHPASPRTIP